MSDDEGQTFQIHTWGEQIGGDKPKNWLGEVDTHMHATPEKLAYARVYWVEIDAHDLEPIGTTGRTFRDRTSGEEYVAVTHDPHAAADPSKDAITHFVTHDNWLWYLRPRGPLPNTVGTGLSAATYGGVIQQDWRGRPILVDENGDRVPTTLTEPKATTFKGQL